MRYCSSALLKVISQLSRVLSLRHDVREETAMFHAQQAVEKMLKSVLVRMGVEFRKTHDLIELADIHSNIATITCDWRGCQRPGSRIVCKTTRPGPAGRRNSRPGPGLKLTIPINVIMMRDSAWY